MQVAVRPYLPETYSRPSLLGREDPWPAGADAVAHAVRARRADRRGPGPRRHRLGSAQPQSQVRRKGRAVDTIVWQTATARLLSWLLKGPRPARYSSPSAAPTSGIQSGTSTRRLGRRGCRT